MAVTLLMRIPMELEARITPVITTHLLGYSLNLSSGSGDRNF